jgi:hypothetical protein
MLRPSPEKRAAGQEIEHRIMLSPRQLEAAFHGEKQTQTNPKTALKLPDLEQSKSAVMNSLT